MTAVQRIRLTVRPPEAGWLPIRLELDDFVLEEWASNVLNDPVESLIEMLEMAERPDPDRVRVCFWLEPALYALDAIREERLAPGETPGTGLLLVRVLFNQAASPPGPPAWGRTMTTCFEGMLESRVLHAALVRALIALVDDPDAAELDHWQRGRTLKDYRDRILRR
jgi:hypothetical protein